MIKPMSKPPLKLELFFINQAAHIIKLYCRRPVHTGYLCFLFHTALKYIYSIKIYKLCGGSTLYFQHYLHH